MQEFYIKKGFQFKGPLGKEEIKLMKLNGSTLIWYKGLADWTAVNEIEELKDFLKVSSCDEIDTTVNSKKKKATVILTIFTIVVLLALAVAMNK